MFGLSLDQTLSLFIFIIDLGIIFIYSKLSDIDKRLYSILKTMDNRKRELDND